MSDLQFEPYCFVVRKSDGKFLRGARFWTWTKNWRHAALLSEGWVCYFLVGRKYGIKTADEIEFYDVELPNDYKGVL